MKAYFLKSLSLKKNFSLLILFGSLSFFITFQFYQNPVAKIIQDTLLPDFVQCNRDLEDLSNHNFNYEKENQKSNYEKKVLVITDRLKKSFSKKIILILESLKLKYRVYGTVSHLLKLYKSGNDAYSVIIFEKLSTYTRLKNIDFNILKKYCKEFNIGVIAFNLEPEDQNIFIKQGLTGTGKIVEKDYHINSHSPLLRITKPGSLTSASYITSHLDSRWTLFQSNHSNYEPVTYIKSTECQSPLHSCTLSPIIRDKGLMDGVDKVIFGTNLDFWLHLMIFMDALYMQARGGLRLPLERNVLVDIDDVFLGHTSTRITRPDVQAMVACQKRISSMVTNFTFNFGFSGKFFLRGSEAEDDGDWALLEAKNNFWWFGHSWSHSKAHNMDLSELTEDMLLNKQFARKHNIPVTQRYAVAPHHAGVYPVHEALYEAWRKVWGVEVTSTEEYPSLWPARFRKGFVHKDIKVLPRQVCDLYTHTIFLDKFPGGPNKFYSNILGGELFLTLLFNPVNIFMTHQSNYANDRLALLTFENVFSFIKCWTNLSLKTIPPTQLAQIYFDANPSELLPLWKSPCESSRHKSIWTSGMTCEQFPRVVVIGPQKTGTTAMHMFLGLHPSLRSSTASNVSFEEVQFFNDKNYYKGINWYLSHFPRLSATTPLNATSKPALRLDLHLDAEEEEEEEKEAGQDTTDASLVQRVFYFEKSASYFADGKVPKRMYNLLPHTKIIAILTNPSLRAYSWYQHMVAHQDPVALKYSFHDIITFKASSPSSSFSTPSSPSLSSISLSRIQDLQNKCLSSGVYAKHINKWLKYYSPEQLLLVDGERLVEDPMMVMDSVQTFLSLQPHIDYSTLIRYNKQKGFYCATRKGKGLRCLGKGKGRDYPLMDKKTKEALSLHYHDSNVALRDLLLKLDYEVPEWLDVEIDFASSLYTE